MRGLSFEGLSGYLEGYTDKADDSVSTFDR